MDFGDSLKNADTALENVDALLEDKDPALGDADKAAEDADSVLEDVDADEADTPEPVAADVVVFDRGVSGFTEVNMIEPAIIDGMIVGDKMKELLVKVGTAMLIGTDEDVFAYGAATELVSTELAITEVRLVWLVIAGTDVFNCVNEVVAGSGRVTELLMKTEPVDTDLLVKTELVEVELLLRTELVGMELLVITVIDVLTRVETLTELLVMGIDTVVLVEFRRGVVGINTGAEVLLVITKAVELELLVSVTLLGTFKTDDDEVIAELETVSGAVVGVQDVTDAESVTVLSYTEVTSLDRTCVEN